MSSLVIERDAPEGDQDPSAIPVSLQSCSRCRYFGGCWGLTRNVCGSCLMGSGPKDRAAVNISSRIAES